MKAHEKVGAVYFRRCSKFPLFASIQACKRFLKEVMIDERFSVEEIRSQARHRAVFKASKVASLLPWIAADKIPDKIPHSRFWKFQCRNDLFWLLSFSMQCNNRFAVLIGSHFWESEIYRFVEENLAHTIGSRKNLKDHEKWSKITLQKKSRELLPHSVNKSS